MIHNCCAFGTADLQQSLSWFGRRCGGGSGGGSGGKSGGGSGGGGEDGDGRLNLPEAEWAGMPRNQRRK